MVFAYLLSFYPYLSPPTLSVATARHVFSFAFLPDDVRLPVQWRIDDATTSSFSPQSRNYRLPKLDGRSRRLMLEVGSSKCWHARMAQHMEQDDHHLRAGRKVGELLYAFSRLAE